MLKLIFFLHNKETALYLHQITTNNNQKKIIIMKVSITTQNFINYSFIGDGKYYTTEQGSRTYKKSYFQKFIDRNNDCIDVLEKGNDAPRGGKLGDYLVVEFNNNFYEKYGKYIESIEKRKKEEAEKEAEREAEKLKQIKEIGDQQKKLTSLFLEDKEFHEKIINRIKNNSSKNWRSWVKLKVCQRLTNEKFSLLTLTPSDIRNIAFRMEEM